jgi:hypothetical protein
MFQVELTNEVETFCVEYIYILYLDICSLEALQRRDCYCYW